MESSAPADFKRTTSPTMPSLPADEGAVWGNSDRESALLRCSAGADGDFSMVTSLPLPRMVTLVWPAGVCAGSDAANTSDRTDTSGLKRAFLCMSHLADTTNTTTRDAGAVPLGDSCLARPGRGRDAGARRGSETPSPASICLSWRLSRPRAAVKEKEQESERRE